MKPIVNVLIVTDDGGLDDNGGFLQWTEQAPADRKGPNNRAFQLGEFVRVLSDTAWLGFDIKLTKAHRTTPDANNSEAVLKADRGADIVGFRFNQPFQVDGGSKTIADYDIVLFFPIASYSPADPAQLQQEAEAIAQFMENGGGFFATGDHEDLGAPLARLIPRVRNMRRWYYQTPPNNMNVPSLPGPNGEPPAPSAILSDRHDTLQKGDNNIFEFEDQSDTVAQQITPALFEGWLGTAGGYPAIFRLPHPLLCSPDGVVTWLPDHMHEGSCEVPADLTQSFKLGATNPREYPDLNGQPLAPVVVATGNVIGGHTTLTLDQPDHGGSDTFPTIATTFGVIAAWDGHRIGKGRVVVDSTWHHFFNINLTGDLFLEGLVSDDSQRLLGFYVKNGMGNLVPTDSYKMIQWYYRNIVYWLIPAYRYQTIWWSALSQMAAMPRFAEEMTRSRLDSLLPHAGQPPQPRDLRLSLNNLTHILYFGQLAEAYLRKTRGACAVADVRIILYKPKIPWWEWVEQIVDPWTQVKQGPQDPGAQLARLAALGLAPRVEMLLQAGFGAALLVAAQGRRTFPRETPEALARRLDGLWTQALQPLIAGFRARLEAGVGLTNELEKALSAPLRAAEPPVPVR